VIDPNQGRTFIARATAIRGIEMLLKELEIRNGHGEIKVLVEAGKVKLIVSGRNFKEPDLAQQFGDG